ncbi:hypothetical protein N431DRAFT_98429 [Stipitochalara longipes BDJ]|nr:hypothetical protein N431DRAFT_98429 [Stipitochalara longipes BDJ]
MFLSSFNLRLLEITTHAGFSISVLLFGAFVTRDMSMRLDGPKTFDLVDTVFSLSILLPRPPSLDNHLPTLS